MLTYPWKCTVLHCNHLGNTWKPLVLMTWHFNYCPSASEGDNQSVRSSAPVVSRCFPGGYNVKLYISRGRLAWWLLAFLCCDFCVNTMASRAEKWLLALLHSERFRLCCLMTPGLGEDIWWGHLVSCMTIPFLTLHLTRSDIRPHIKLAVSLVIVYGHFNLPLGFRRKKISEHMILVKVRPKDRPDRGSNSWQCISCHWSACSNHSVIIDFWSVMVLVYINSSSAKFLKILLRNGGWISDSYCSLKPLWSGMGGEVVPARTSPTLHPPSPPTVL